MSRVGPKPKKLPVEHTTSAAAVDRIANFVHLMDHEFHQFGPPETGIDGSIELSDPATHTMTGKVIFMQSKSHTGVFEKETENAFEFPLERRDLDGWLALTVPVILIVSRPARDQYFWVDIKNYFEQSARSERAVVEFDKDRDRFTEDCSADLFEVVEREANRRALVRRALVHGPVYLLKLDEELERARLAASQQRFNDSAPLWAQIANAAEEKLPAPFTWTFREREANALNTIGRHEDAYKIYLQLVRDRLDADDPSAQFDIGRAYFAHRTGVAEDFEFALLAARAATPIDGSDGIERLRLLHERAPTTAEKVEAAAALVDVLAFWGEWDEVIAVTDRVALKRLNPLRRQLLLDRLDALGERGIACDDDWARLLKSSRQVGQSVHAQTLQRRAVALSRTSDIEAAQEYFRKAAEFWSDVPEADEQVAEALAGVEATARLGGLLTPDALPFAANHVFAVARGSAMLPVARAERVMLAGFAALADGGTANALRFLTLAAMIERRAGDLAGYLQATAGVARAYEAAGDPKTALQWWIRTGRADRVEPSAAKVSYEDGKAMLALERGPIYERAASFATLNVWAGDLSDKQVSSITKATLAQAKPRPRPLGPSAGFQARKLLTQIAPRFTRARAREAAAIFRDEVQNYGYTRGDSAGALVELTNNGIVDSVPFFVEMILAEEDPEVSIAGYLQDAPQELQQQIVDAAVAGNLLALDEAAAADLPDTFPELRDLCSAQVRALLEYEPEEGVQLLGVSYRRYAGLGRHCGRQLQRHLVDYLLTQIFSEQIDEMTKVAAIQCLGWLAPGLERKNAGGCLGQLLTIAGDGDPASVPRKTSGRRARRGALHVRFDSGGGMQAAAIVSCARLTQRARSGSRELSAVLKSALDSERSLVVINALSVIAHMPQLRVGRRPTDFVEDPRPEVREAAQQYIGANAAPPS
jgi:tetratricopeptide (TPR) repeat protein